MEYKRDQSVNSPETARPSATSLETAEGRYGPSHRAAEGWTIGRAEVSTRRLGWGRKLWYGLLASLLGGIMRWFWWSCRIQRVIGGEHLDALQSSGSPAIIAYWHQMQLLCANYLLRRAKAGDRIAFLISPSLTGEVPATAARKWNVHVLRGSSTRSGGRAMREMHQLMVRDQYSIVLAADGPRGPLHEFKPGALLISRMAGAPIVPIAYAAEHCINWNSWDRFVVPLPFTRVTIAIGEPFQPPKDTRIEDLPQVQRQVEALMQETVALANDAAKER